MNQVIRSQGRDNGQQHADGGDKIPLPGRTCLAEHLQPVDEEHGRNDVQ